MHEATSLPIVSIALTTTISCLLALIVLGSSVAFNDVVSLTINGLYSSYLVGNTLLLYRRLTGGIKPYDPNVEDLDVVPSADELTWGPWKVPEPFGTIINAIGCIFMLIILFFSFWPTTLHPTASLMNFSSLMMGATMIFSCIYYVVWARKIYSGPIIEIA